MPRPVTWSMRILFRPRAAILRRQPIRSRTVALVGGLPGKDKVHVTAHRGCPLVAKLTTKSATMQVLGPDECTNVRRQAYQT